MISRVTQKWAKCRKYHKDKDGEDMKKLHKKLKLSLKNTQKQKIHQECNAKFNEMTRISWIAMLAYVRPKTWHVQQRLNIKKYNNFNHNPFVFIWQISTFIAYLC